MDNCRGDKKPPMSTYQQSFRIDDLLTRKVIEQQQQPDHFAIYAPIKMESNDILNLTTIPHEDIVSDVKGHIVYYLNNPPSPFSQISDGTEICEHSRGIIYYIIYIYNGCVIPIKRDVGQLVIK